MTTYTPNTFKYSNKTYTVFVNLFTNNGDPKNGLQISIDAADI